LLSSDFLGQGGDLPGQLLLDLLDFLAVGALSLLLQVDLIRELLQVTVHLLALLLVEMSGGLQLRNLIRIHLGYCVTLGFEKIANVELSIAYFADTSLRVL